MSNFNINGITNHKDIELENVKYENNNNSINTSNNTSVFDSNKKKTIESEDKGHFEESVDKNGTKTKKYYNSNNILTRQISQDNNGNITTIVFEADGKTPIIKESQSASSGNSKTYFENGIPVKNEIIKGTTKSIYNYDENGKPILTSKFSNEGIPNKEEKIQYTYNKDGSITETITNSDKLTKRVSYNGNILFESIKENDSVKNRTFYEKGIKEEVIDKNGNSTINIYDLKNKKLLQQKVVNGKVITTYDAEEEQQKKLQKEYKTTLKNLGEKLQVLNTKGQGQKITGRNKNGKESSFILIGQLPKNRKAVIDKNGKIQVISHNGEILSPKYLQKEFQINQLKNDPKTGRQATCKTLEQILNNARNNFEEQLKKDGWAADVADGVSNLWGWAQKDGNQAWRVRKDLQKFESDINELKNIAKKNNQELFNSKFKEMFGVDYNQKSIANFIMHKSDTDYTKAFGTNNNITKRIINYNISQQVGGEVVKGGATIASGIGIGLLTGGTGAVPIIVSAIGTGASSVVINSTDRMSSEVGLRNEDLNNILGNAAWDTLSVGSAGVLSKVTSSTIKGVNLASKLGRASFNAIGDVSMGAIQEYAQTGQVSVGGTAMNSALGAVGIGVESGALKKGYNIIKNQFHKGNSNIPTTNLQMHEIYSEADLKNGLIPEGLAGGGDKKPVGTMNKIASNFKSKLGMYDNDMEEFLDRNGLQSVYLDKKNNPNSFYSKELLNAKAGKPLVKDLGYVNPRDISKYVDNGELALIQTIRKGDRIFINDNGKPIEINVSPEKFNELFDPLKIATFEQPGSRNNCCTIYANINSALSTSQGRVKLFSMFSEQPDGSINVKLNYGRAVNFPNGKPFKNFYTSSSGTKAKVTNGSAPGPEMILQTFLIHKSTPPKSGVLTKADIDSEAMAEKILDFRAGGESANCFFGEEPKLYKSSKDPASVEQALKEFNPEKDIITTSWEWHARSIVDYDPTSKMITYKDPMYGGLCETISLQDFIKKKCALLVTKDNSVEIPRSTSPTPTKEPSLNTTPKVHIIGSPTPTKEPSLNTTPKVHIIGSPTPTKELSLNTTPKVRMEETPNTQQHTISQAQIPNGYREYKRLNGVQTYINDNFEVCCKMPNGTIKMLDINQDFETQISAAIKHTEPQIIRVNKKPKVEDTNLSAKKEPETPIQTVSKNKLDLTQQSNLLPTNVTLGRNRIGTQCYNFAGDPDEWFLNKKTGKFGNMSSKIRHVMNKNEFEENIRELPNGIKQIGTVENRPIYMDTNGKRWYGNQFGEFVEYKPTSSVSNNPKPKRIIRI